MGRFFRESKCRLTLFIIFCRQTISGVAVVGGRLNTSLENSLLIENNSELKVLAVTRHGKILLWQESDPHLVRCVLSLNREISIAQIYMNVNEILFVNSEGEAFRGSLKNRKRRKCESNSYSKNIFHKFIEKNECHYVKITKLSRIHRALSITSDTKGRNFAVIQVDPKVGLNNIPEPIFGTFTLDFRKLLDESNEDDFVHDVIFKVNKTTYTAHQYIIACCSSLLLKLMAENKTIELENVHSDIFQELLLWIYTGDCTLSKVGVCPNHLLKLSFPNFHNDFLLERKQNDGFEDSLNVSEIFAFEYYNKDKNKDTIPNIKTPIHLLQDLAKQFEIDELEKHLSKLTIRNGHIEYTKTYSESFCLARRPFNRSLHEDLYDIDLRTKGGYILRAHKCVLVARVDFFQRMFSSRWDTKVSKSEVQLHYTKNVVEIFLEYLYTDNIAKPTSLDLDTLCNLIILSDEYFIVRLREICESTLCNLLTFKNAVHLLTIASLYHAENLEVVTMKFICLNLHAFLELKYLENLNDDILNKLTSFYGKFNKIIQGRIISPYSTAPTDDAIRNISNRYSISLDIDDEFKVKKSGSKTQRKRLKSHKANIDDSKTGSSLMEKDESEESCWVKEKQNTDEHSFAKLSVLQSDSSFNSFETSFENFPSLNDTNTSFHSKSSNKAERMDKHKIVRPSQKQRNRLSSEYVQESTTFISDSLKNPWKANEIQSAVGSPEEKPSFNAILTEEKKFKENINKIINKSLAHTQIEDKAIEDLRNFYNSSNCHEEIITVERLFNRYISMPVWVHKTKGYP